MSPGPKSAIMYESGPQIRDYERNESAIISEEMNESGTIPGTAPRIRREISARGLKALILGQVSVCWFHRRFWGSTAAWTHYSRLSQKYFEISLLVFYFAKNRDTNCSLGDFEHIRTVFRAFHVLVPHRNLCLWSIPSSPHYTCQACHSRCRTGRLVPGVTPLFQPIERVFTWTQSETCFYTVQNGESASKLHRFSNQKRSATSNPCVRFQGPIQPPTRFQHSCFGFSCPD